MHGHLVAIEVRVERRADERMQLNRLTLDEHGLERLNAQAMQRRRTIEHDGMLANDLRQNVPDLRPFALDETLGRLDRRRLSTKLQLREDKRLEQLQRQLLRQAALMQLQRRSDDDN